jgi:uncharacterized membrane protein
VTPPRFRVVVSTVLLVGVSVAAALIAVGFVEALLVGWSGSLLAAAGTTSKATDFASFADNVRALSPIGFVQLGLIVLILTPVVRVAASIVGFWLQGDRLYVAITAIVLAVLLASLLVLR